MRQVAVSQLMIALILGAGLSGATSFRCPEEALGI